MIEIQIKFKNDTSVAHLLTACMNWRVIMLMVGAKVGMVS